MTYPDSPRSHTHDTYHGVRVADPYRWLENLDTEQGQAWIQAQNALTRSWLDPVPLRSTLTKRLTELWNYPRYGAPNQTGGRLFFMHNTGLQNQPMLMVSNHLEASPSTLLNPNTLAVDGTVALSGWSISPQGTHLCYALSKSGSDWQTWYVRDIATKRDLADKVAWSKFSSCAWAPDGSGFYYSRYPTPTDPKSASLTHNKLYFHALGTPQSSDQVIAENASEPSFMYHGQVTDDGSLLLVSITEGTGEQNRLYYYNLAMNPTKPIALVDVPDAAYYPIDRVQNRLYLHTTWQAPTGRIVAVDLNRPGREHWVEVLPASHQVIDKVQLAGERLVVARLHQAHSQLTVHDLAGTLVHTVPLPDLGTVTELSGRQDSNQVFYSFTGYTRPTSVYALDVDTLQSTVWQQPQVAFNPNDFETNQVVYNSADGTQIPMFVVAKKGITLDGSHPTELYGYGGFNVSLTPTFSPANVVWMEHGGVLAVPSLRGGGEFGETWHQAGIKLHKQRVFDDVIAAAEWLIAKGYTKTPQLAIRGGSNGGLMVGAVLTQRPALFGAAVAQVGVFDMLRYHRFTIGWAWADDYGTVDDSPEMFRYLLAYSPLHNAKPAVYPPTLLTTAEHDDRVVPAHSAKFAAALQHAQQGPAPVLIRIETDAGHGAGTPTTTRIAELVDRFSFLSRAMHWPNRP